MKKPKYTLTPSGVVVVRQYAGRPCKIILNAYGLAFTNGVISDVITLHAGRGRWTCDTPEAWPAYIRRAADSVARRFSNIVEVYEDAHKMVNRWRADVSRAVDYYETVILSGYLLTPKMVEKLRDIFVIVNECDPNNEPIKQRIKAVLNSNADGDPKHVMDAKRVFYTVQC